MENILTRWLYNNSPDVFKDAFASVYGWTKNRKRYCPAYHKWRRFFEEACTWPHERLVAYQEHKLQEMVAHCYEHVPFYRCLFESLKLTPEDIRTLDDLQKLPILDKPQVREAGEDLLADNCDRNQLATLVTSGSTGTPLSLYRSQDMTAMEWASMWTRRRPGMKRGDPWSSFAGLEIIDPNCNKPPFWRNNWASNQRMFSIFHMNDNTLPYYYEALNNRYSRFYSGYTTPVYMIIDFMERNGLKIEKPPEAVFSSSEELKPVHKEKIEETFGCKVWNHYGMGEMVASFVDFPCGHMHYEMDYSIVEFEPIGEEDGLVLAEVIGTHLYMKEWPLLRYRTADLVLIDPDATCDHNVPGQIIHTIHGRTGHYFVLPNGSRVSNISVIAKKCHNIRFMQVIQEREGEIIVHVVPHTEYTQNDEEEVKEQFRKKIGSQLQIHVQVVEDVQRTRAGKYLSIINRIDKLPVRM